jgi:hypothetical protein
MSVEGKKKRINGKGMKGDENTDGAFVSRNICSLPRSRLEIPTTKK